MSSDGCTDAGNSSRAAAPVLYAIGEFRFEAAGESTRVHWTYSFKLRDDRFPGTLGATGRRLFRKRFLERDYAMFMDAVVRDTRAWAARLAAGGGSPQ